LFEAAEESPMVGINQVGFKQEKHIFFIADLSSIILLQAIELYPSSTLIRNHIFRYVCSIKTAKNAWGYPTYFLNNLDNVSFALYFLQYCILSECLIEQFLGVEPTVIIIIFYLNCAPSQ